MKTDAQTRDNPFKIRRLVVAAVAAIALAPACAHAQSAPPMAAKDPGSGYFGDRPFVSWLDMVSASQASQPSWMTPLVTVTPRLEQEFRFDAYNQQNGKGSQGNGQQITSYGGPGGVRLELIPAYNWEVILAAPPYETATGPKGAGQGWGDWPAFLIKYRLLSANKDNGDYIVTAFFQMSDPLNAPAKISNNILTAQPTLAFGKGWGDFDIQSTISVQVPVAALNAPGNPAATTFANFGYPYFGTPPSSIICSSTFGRNSRLITRSGQTGSMSA
jgi:hypothetical protein